jgi:hypothetical protein
LSYRQLALATAAGLLLASLPFVRYVHLLNDGEAHADHEPRHGGQLGMVGEYHIEVRRHAGRVEAFVSDAWRRPLRPREGAIVFDRGSTTPLKWEGYRLVGPDAKEAREVEAIAWLADGTRLAVSFDFSSAP